jgi:hypothetical protein
VDTELNTAVGEFVEVSRMSLTKKIKSITSRLSGRTDAGNTGSKHLSVITPRYPAPSVFAFALAKAGSTLLYSMLQYISKDVPIDYRSPDDEMFARNISREDRKNYVGDIFFENGFCYGGFRGFPLYEIPNLHQHKVVLLVRDPRDIAVSLYFSLLKSHVLPSGVGVELNEGAANNILTKRKALEALTPDEHARSNIPAQTKSYLAYFQQDFHKRENVAVYRYEDVIYQKADWLRSICEWYGWKVSDTVINRAVSSQDIFPDSERQDQHVRQVHPGNHKQHLSAETLAMYRDALGEYAGAFGYKL